MAEQTDACLDVYRTDHNRVEEDAKIEITAAEGGYGDRQVFELIQNAADALKGITGRIQLVLTEHAFYIANAGNPFTEEGVKSILASHLSRKTDEQIGQFGLGFKSVLAVTDGPIVLSRSGSFRFDREWAQRRIMEAGVRTSKYPVLRLAEPIDVESIDDSVVRSLMPWATTIIKLPLKARKDLIAQEMHDFPAEFLLFSPDITELVIDDRTGGGVRTIRLSGDKIHGFFLNNGEKTTGWYVTTRVHHPTKSAIRDAGELGRRDSVDVTWARPTSGSSVGRFWAFFPTSASTTLSGIVNAPWKLSSDRMTILQGPFNEELLTEVLPDVVADSLPAGYRPDDPAVLLDVLPARGREARSWADDIINGPIFSAVSATPCVPDFRGVLRRPSSMKLHPKDLPAEWKALWTVPDEQASGWVSHDVDSDPARRLKVERLMQCAGSGPVSLTAWLEAMVADRSPRQSALAIILAAMIVREKPTWSNFVREAKIVLLDDGTLVRPLRGRVFVRSEDQSGDHSYVHPDLLSDPSVDDALGDLGIETLDTAGRLRAALQTQPLQSPQWRVIWDLIRQIDMEIALSIMREELPSPLVASVHVQMKSGKWWPIQRGFLNGEVIPTSANRDAEYLIDPVFHARDTSILQRMGAVPSPRLISGLPDEPWLTAYKQKWTEKYLMDVFKGRGQLEQIEITGEAPPWPLELMNLVSTPAKIEMSLAILISGRNSEWMIRHRTKGQSKKVAGPAVQRLKEYGYLPTPIGPYQARRCLHPELDGTITEAEATVLPIADVSSDWADVLELPKSPMSWSNEKWNEFVSDMERTHSDASSRLYVLAARMGRPAPDRILADCGGSIRHVPPEEVAVTADPDKLRSLTVAGLSCLLAPDEAGAAILRTEWGLADAADMLREEVVAVPDAEPVLLIDRFPPLKFFNREVPDLEQLVIQTCSTITVLVSTPKGQESSNRPYHRVDKVINVVHGTDQEILRILGDALHIDIDIANVLRQIKEKESSQRRIQIRRQTSVEEKLVAAVGSDRLMGILPQPAISDIGKEVGRPLTDTEVARLCLAVHGFSVLSELKKELADAGLEPPKMWAGGTEARRFVESLGFPLDYAGYAGVSLPPRLEIAGPIVLPQLHEYQQKLVDNVHGLLSQPDSRRGLISLPTGAGKTRVIVQSLVQMACAGRLTGTVVWIAQTEELCEQAVQSWAEIWRAIGPSDTLILSRMWGSNDVDDESGLGLQVVVATIDKLREAIDNPRYSWLSNPELIILDEAHVSTASSYTRVLQWLGESTQVSKVSTPMIGLTATPFRGINEEETKRLVARYGSRRLDTGIFGDADPYDYLQGINVLSRVTQHLLRGIDIDIDDNLKGWFDQFHGVPSTLPPSIEERLGKNTERNRAIVKSIMDLPRDWPILVFATSVENAKVLAAELSYQGVEAHPIVGTTPTALRRHYIEQFRRGDVHVLTNFNVLTQGFDAPKVRAVYVTRPTFSPNLYQQMIGRGLRGPLNGGSEECLIVNVEDNISMYGDNLAFRHFEYLWSDHG